MSGRISARTFEALVIRKYVVLYRVGIESVEINALFTAAGSLLYYSCISVLD